MSRIRANTITNQNANGAPNFPDGITVSGVVTATTTSQNITGDLTVTGNVGVGGTLTYEDVTNIDSVGLITARNGALIRAGSATTSLIVEGDARVTGILTVGSGSVTIDNNGLVVSSGIITATSFRGDASQMTGAGLGTDGSANTSGIVTATAFVTTTGQLSNRNILRNGDFNVAQRGTSITSSNAYIVDRWKLQSGNLDENCTQNQESISAGTDPWKLGFRKCWKITNGNQTGGGGSNDYIELYQYIEGNVLATCGWDYTNPNSKMTLSFWIKSSVAQTFPGFLYTTQAGSNSVHYMYDYVIGDGTSNLTADTWTKVTHTFPGHASLNVDNDNNYGMGFGIYPYSGTNLTTSRAASNAWQTWATTNKTPDVTTTWYTTNNATLELTGFQLEVGPVATPFEHIPYYEELRKCQRYYNQPTKDFDSNELIYGGMYATQHGTIRYDYPTRMRARPTITYDGIRTTGSLNLTERNGTMMLGIFMNHTSPYIDGMKLNSEL